MQWQLLAATVIALAVVIVGNLGSIGGNLASAQQQQVTYQGVLRMLNNCVVSYNSQTNGNAQCQTMGKTCILGHQEANTGQGPPIECEQFGGIAVHWVCCSP